MSGTKVPYCPFAENRPGKGFGRSPRRGCPYLSTQLCTRYPEVREKSLWDQPVHRVRPSPTDRNTRALSQWGGYWGIRAMDSLGPYLLPFPPL